MGRVAAPWGIKGWIKVHPLTQSPVTLLEIPSGLGAIHPAQ